jgi:hypothetical protein
MQEQLLEHQPIHSHLVVTDDIRDSVHCLIVIYGEEHIDTLAHLLSLTAYAENEYSHFCVLRHCK